MYYRQLDSLRALAVMMVITFHWKLFSKTTILPIGLWGVELFFVLSGFLITKILLQSRIVAEARSQNKLYVLKNFVARRSLRIFPIYYLALIIILIFDRGNFLHLQENLGWYAGYAANFLIFKTQVWPQVMSHFWTLAAEEQFYLIWPWFVLFLPWKYLRPFFITSIFIAIASRLILPAVLFHKVITTDILTPACIDCFSIGAIFSICLVDKKYDLTKLVSTINKLAISWSLLLTVFLLTGFGALSFLYRTLDAIVFVALIAGAVKGFKGLPGAIADNRMIIYIGKISYGLYIYHLLTPWLTVVLFNFLSKLKITFITATTTSYYRLAFLPKFIIDLLILFTVASASWFLIEKPFNRLKRFFNDKRLNVLQANAGIAAGLTNYSITE